MINLNSKIAQFLEQLVNRWSFWEEYEEYYLEELVPELMVNLADWPDRWERELFHEIRKVLAPEDWRNLPELIREYRVEAHKQKERERKKQTLLKSLREHLERDFSMAYDFYQTQCTAYISSEEYETEKNNVERRKKEHQLQRERQEKVRREREAQQRAEKKHQEAIWRREKKERQKQAQRERERQEAVRRREEERQKQAQREKEKQTLLKDLRKRLERDFLTAYNFYQARCTNRISFKEYETEKTNYVRSWAKNHVDINPDRQQAAAIGAVEGNVQVVARAGSGKTATLVNRALFLHQHCNVAPDKMLLLAFNRKAAEEMRDRLASDLQDSIPHVMTFHALANALVHPEKILFDEPDGEQSQSRALQDIIDHYLRDSNYYNEIRALMMAHFRADWAHIVSGGYHKIPEELLRYRRLLPQESLDGTYVKSSPEKIIANFLFEHDIEYKYEWNFWWNSINYRPDFTIFTGENRGVIIEYFGLEDDLDYDAMSEEKRSYWGNRPQLEIT